jgi:hypothetical protein
VRFGPNTAPLAILRRPVVVGDPNGDPRGDFATVFSTWCSWRVSTSQRQDEGGLAEDVTAIVVRVNDGVRNRTISLADRAVLNGANYAVASTSPPDRVGGFIEISLKRQLGG